MLISNSAFESNYTVSFNNALAKPTYAQKCQELTKLIEESNPKVLNKIYVQLLSNIFGIGSPGWCLPSISSNQNNDYVALRGFLGPKGAIFKMIERLQLEGSCRYDLPNCLAIYFMHFKSQDVSSLSIGASKYNHSYNGLQNFGINQLKPQSLNRMVPFELYFHLFAFSIMSSSQLVGPIHKTDQLFSPYTYLLHEDNVYYALLEDYLNYYLPNDGSNPPIINVPTASTHVRSPIKPFTSVTNYMLKRKSPKASSGLSVSYHEIWRSEMLFHTLVEVWTCHPHIKNNIYNNKFNTTLSEALLRVVRKLIKHLHLFSNSHKSDVQQMNAIDGVMDQFIQSLCMYVQPKLLAFLTCCFETWPLDSSFRIVLEAWLSYIQPWRYISETKSNTANADMRLNCDKEIANCWYSFIISNLPFFNRMFYLSLTRFLRMDLSLHLNSLLLFRVAKIFSRSNFIMMIEEAEIIPCLGEGTIMYNHIDPTSFMSIMRSQTSIDNSSIYNISSNETKALIYQLIVVCKQALGTIRSQLKQQGNDWNEWLMNLFSSSSDQNSFLGGNLKKSEQYLIDSIRLFSTMFSINIEDIGDTLDGNNKDSNQEELIEKSLYDEDGNVSLTEAGRFYLMNNIKKVPVVPKCDPALQPICNFECPPLVRAFYKLSCKINKRYELSFKKLCQRKDFIGLFSRHYLQPAHYVDCSKTVYVMKDQSPRVNLRLMANYRILLYFFAYLVINHFCGINLLSSLFNLFVLVLLYMILEVLYFSFCKNEK